MTATMIWQIGNNTARVLNARPVPVEVTSTDTEFVRVTAEAEAELARWESEGGAVR